jgi:hypothetical protein
MEQKVESVEIRKIEPLDGAGDHSIEMFRYALDSHLAPKQRKPFRAQGDQADIGGVTFVTGAGVRELEQPDAHQTISTLVVTTRLSTNAGQ